MHGMETNKAAHSSSDMSRLPSLLPPPPSISTVALAKILMFCLGRHMNLNQLVRLTNGESRSNNNHIRCKGAITTTTPHACPAQGTGGSKP